MPKNNQTNLFVLYLSTVMSHEDTSPSIAPPKLKLEPKHASTSPVRTSVDEELVVPQFHHQSDTTRRSIIAAYWIVIALCLPIWWNLTSIERLSLPKTRIERLHREGHKVRQTDLDGPNPDILNTLDGFEGLCSYVSRPLILPRGSQCPVPL